MNKLKMLFNKIGFIISIVLLIAILTTSCANRNYKDELIFSLTPEQQQHYIQQIEEIINEYYWSYDKDSLVFSSYIIPDNTDMFDACNVIDKNLSSYINKDSVLGQSNLIHYNGDIAGTINFIFFKDELVGSFYIGGFDNSIYSLKQRNPFMGNGNFLKYENWTEIYNNHTELSGDFSINGIIDTSYNDTYGNIMLGINDNSANLYRIQGNSVVNYKSIKYNNEELKGATFINISNQDQLAVLLSTSNDTSSTSKVVFYNENGTEVNQLNLGDSSYSAINKYNDQLILFSDFSIEYYSYANNIFSLANRVLLKNTVINSHIVDIDNDGKTEFILTDGKDIYIYQQTASGLQKIWSTHLGVENLYSFIGSGDLNNNGIREIYISDNTGTSIRYTLTPKGLQSSNEDILYGQQIFPCDLNNDGITDYWNILLNENYEGKFYLSK